MSDFLVPEDLRVVQNTRTIRLGIMEAALTPPRRGASEGATDGYDIRLVPLADAYLIGTWPARAPQAGSASTNDWIRSLLWPYFVARTNAAGHMVLRSYPNATTPTLLSLHPSVFDPVPQADVRELPSIHQSGPVWWASVADGDAGAMNLATLELGFGLFWTYHRDVFEAVIVDLEHDHARAYRTHGFVVLDGSPRDPPRAARATPTPR